MGLIYQIKHKLIEKREEYFLWRKYIKKPRFTQYKVRFKNKTFVIPDAQSFAAQVWEIFADDIYRFESDNDTPLIYDIGANIGMSVFYFKRLFKNAKIKAYEADKDIFVILQQNTADLTDIELHNNAVWINDDELSFFSQGADGGSLITAAETTQKIKAVRLKTLLDNEAHIDFLKMDIEGAETEVILDSKDTLHKIDKLFIEYHSFKGQKQTLPQILNCLTNAGFRYYMQTVCGHTSPFCYNNPSEQMDLQINIYGYRG